MTKLKSYEGQEKNRHVRRMSCVMGQYSSGVFVICKPFPIGDAGDYIMLTELDELCSPGFCYLAVMVQQCLQKYRKQQCHGVGVSLRFCEPGMASRIKVQ